MALERDSATFSPKYSFPTRSTLFPKSLSVYVDDLSVALSATKTGCVISDTSINHVFYVDDKILKIK